MNRPRQNEESNLVGRLLDLKQHVRHSNACEMPDVCVCGSTEALLRVAEAESLLLDEGTNQPVIDMLNLHNTKMRMRMDGRATFVRRRS